MANTQNLDLVKPLGTDHALVSVLNSNSDKIDAYAGAVNAGLDGLRDGLGILANGNTHAAITSGQFVYVKNHQTLPEGLYKASTNIAANGTLSTSNLTADPKGGLNTLSEQIGTLDSKIQTPNMFKKATETMTTSQLGNANITTVASGFVIIAIKPPINMGIGFIGKGTNGAYYAHIVDSTGATISNTEVTLEIYYV